MLIESVILICWQKFQILVCRYHVVAHILPIVSSVSPESSGGRFLRWNGVRQGLGTPLLWLLPCPWAVSVCRHSPRCVSMQMYKPEKKKKKNVNVCVTVPKAERNTAHISCWRRGRQPQSLTQDPSAENAKTLKRWCLETCPHFSFFLIHFTNLIYRPTAGQHNLYFSFKSWECDAWGG